MFGRNKIKSNMEFSILVLKERVSSLEQINYLLLRRLGVVVMHKPAREEHMYLADKNEEGKS